MINIIWGVMIVAGMIYGAINGSDVVEQISGACIDSTKEAIELCIVMLGVVGMWNGVINIARRSGLLDIWTKKMDGFISFMFPAIEKEDEVRKDIATNLIANILGIGWAATPSGIEAMKKLAKKSKNKTATDEMCTLLVLNISSLQLIPMNIIAYRAQYQSVSPMAVIGPGLIATLGTTIAAIIFCKLMQGLKPSHQKYKS